MLTERRTVLVSCLLVVALTAHCANPEGPDPAPPASRIDDGAIATFLADFLEEEHVPGIAASIIVDGGLVWTGGQGWADVAGKRAMSPETITNVASITKTVTNAAILQLRDEGRFALDDPINDHLPFEVVHPDHPDVPITFRHLLTHTAAVGDGDAYDASYACGDPAVGLGEWLEGYFTPGGAYYDAEQNFLDHAPREKYSYSNLGYGLLGHLVETVSGRSLADYTRSRIFEPLGMTSTGWYLSTVDLDRHATPYAWVEAGETLDNALFGDRDGEVMSEDGFVPFCHYSFYNLPDGLVRTSVNDLSRFLLAHMNGGDLDGHRVLAVETTAEIFRRQLEPERLKDWEGTQGLTWRTREIAGAQAWEHSGADPGVRTRMLFIPDEGIGVIVFANRVVSVQPVVDMLVEQARVSVAARTEVPTEPPTPEPRPETTLSAPDVSASTTALANAIDLEIARAEQYLGQLESFATESRATAESELAQREASHARVAELDAELRLHRAGSREVGALYQRIIVELQAARPLLTKALDRQGHPVAVPTFEPRLDPTGLDVPTMQDRLRRLRELRHQTDTRWIELADDDERLRWKAVEGWGSITARLNELRNVAIERLPAARRRQVLGLSAEGFEQFRQEVRQLELSAHLYRVRQRNRIAEVPGQLLDVFAVGSLTWTLLKILAAVLLFFFVRRRGSRIRSAAYRFVDQGLATRGGRRRGEALVGILEVLAPWGLLLALIEVLRWALGPLALMPEFDLPLRLASTYALYRLAIDALFAASVRIARRYRLSLDEGRTAKVFRSVRTLMRVLVAILMLLILSERFVGRGHIYHLVLRFSWIFVLGMALLLLARWRRVIADAYLDLGRTGRLAALVRRSRDRWYGVFVSGAAFVLLAGRAALQVGQDFVMGFDQTRHALAFVFRRRVEKSAEQRGYAEVDLDDLPRAVVQACSEEPLSEDTPRIDHFPGLERLQKMIDPWLADEAGASFLLTGEKGMGKTSWLNRIEPGETPIDHMTLTHRLLSETRLVSTLSKELDLPLEEGAGMIALHKALLNGPKRIVTVDLGQNLFLSKVGGYDTFEKFVSLVEATCGQVFWVCTISAFAWDHLSAVRPDLMVFRDRETLKPWSEDQIGQMLDVRIRAAGIELVYDDLLLETRPRRDSSIRQETAQQYMRLLWDTSDGNPRAALHFWLRSLVPDSPNRMRVRLFRGPTSVDLDPLGERSRFLLAAIVVHENLSLSEAEIVTRYPRAVCRLQLERLVDQGILQRTNGRYRLTTHFHRAVVRFLKRGNLLSD